MDNELGVKPAETGPSCPYCGTNHRVTKDYMGGTKDHHIPGRRVWLCGTCWTVFQGGQHEWDRCREMREAYRKRHEARAVAA